MTRLLLLLMDQLTGHYKLLKGIVHKMGKFVSICTFWHGEHDSGLTNVNFTHFIPFLTLFFNSPPDLVLGWSVLVLGWSEFVSGQSELVSGW